MERGAGMEVFFIPCRKGFTLRRLRGGVRARSGRGGWSIFYDCRHFATPQKFALRIFTPPRRRRRVRYMETFIILKQNKSPPY